MNPPTLGAAFGGPRHLLHGYRLLLRPGVRGMMWIPVLGNALLFTLAGLGVVLGLDAAMERWLPAAADWLRWVLYPLALIMLMLLGFFTFALIGNLLLAPFHGLLSERVELALTGVAPPGSGRSFWKTIGPALREELLRLAHIAIRMLAVFALSLIPVVGLLAFPLGILLGAWLLAMEFAAHPLSNSGLDFAGQREFMRQHRAGFLGFGLSAMGLALVPVINLALLPAAVAGMTAYCVQLRAQAAQASSPHGRPATR
jgi:CysZ protein